MRKSLLATAVVGVFSLPAVGFAADAAPASPHTLTGNITAATDYRFRGVSQTFKEPTIQGGVDYSHSSGLYLGTWASNVTGTNGASLGVGYLQGSMEWDVYGGYKFEVAKDVTLDVGVLTYMYPGARWGVNNDDKFTNTEVYLGASYKWLTAKYSRSITDYFGAKSNTVGLGVTPVTLTGFCGVESDGVTASSNCATSSSGSSGSSYLDLSAAYPLTEKLTLNAHIGRLSVKNYGLFDYTDYKLGVNYDLNGWSLGANYITTNAKKDVYRTIHTKSGTPPTLDVKETSTGTLVLSVGKTF